MPLLPLDPADSLHMEAHRRIASCGFADPLGDLPIAGIKTAVLGDSIANRNFDGLTKTGVTTDDRHIAYPVVGYAVWANVLLGQPLMLRNNGVSAETAAQVRARVGQVWDDTDLVMLLCGTNNIGGGVSYPSAYTTLVGDIGWMVDYFAKRGIPVLIGTIPGETSLSAGDIPTLAMANKFIRELPRTYRNCLVADYFLALADATSATFAPRTNMTTDGAHPSNIGAFYMGQEAARTLAPFLNHRLNIGSTSTADNYGTNTSITQLIDNPGFTGSGGTSTPGSGTITDLSGGAAVIPAGWRVWNNGGTPTTRVGMPLLIPRATLQRGFWATTTMYQRGDGVTNSGSAYVCLHPHTSGTFATDLSNGLWALTYSSGNMLELDITFNGSSDGVQLYKASEFSGRISGPSKILQAYCEIQVERMTLMKELDLSVNRVIDTNTYTCRALGAASFGTTPVDLEAPWEGALLTPPATNGTVGSSAITSLNWHLNIGQTANTGRCRIRISRPAMWVIN